jgi:hypothetical protein
MDGPFDRSRYDLGVAVIAICVPDQRRDHQRHIHHQALHGLLLGAVGAPVLKAA